MKAQPGHLSYSGFLHKPTEATRLAQSKRQQYNEVMKKAQPVSLGWKAGLTEKNK
jgi:hypothetical protein